MYEDFENSHEKTKSYYSTDLFHVVGGETHARQQLPHGQGEVEVQGLLGPHGHPKQDPEELEVLEILRRVAAGVEHETVRVEAALVGSVSRGNEQLDGSALELLVEEGLKCNCAGICMYVDVQAFTVTACFTKYRGFSDIRTR